MQVYKNLLSENVTLLVKEEVRDIFKFLLRRSKTNKYDFYCAFPSLFAKAVAHFEQKEVCTTPGCKPVPDPIEYEDDNVPKADVPLPTHLEYVKNKIQCFTALDLISDDHDYQEDVLTVPMSDIDFAVARMLSMKHKPVYKGMADECLRAGCLLVGL